jgi:hypothetical protein
MANVPQQQWFEMDEVRRRRLTNAVWVPLRQSETITQQGEANKVGSLEEIVCVGSVAIDLGHREIGDKLGWSDIGLIHEPRPYAFDDGRYKPADVYLHNDREVVGVELVLVHSINSLHARKWWVNQDLVIALGLIEEGDVWKRPDEGYIDVIRTRRDSTGRVVSIEIRSEFLRDYLRARGLALRVAQYRQRMAILADPSYLAWAKEPKETDAAPGRFSARVFEIDAEGGVPGRVAVMKVWRTDVDKDEDVPVFGKETSDNTAYESHSYERIGAMAYRAEGELWREEWIEPAPLSERIRGDRPPDEFFYFVSAAGERVPSSALNDEDVGRWLWFRPEVIEALLQFRGSGLFWYTRDTGSVRCSPDYGTHFGVNEVGYINVYAYDIVKLPHWQQRIWVGFNVAPDAPVSSELLDAQMRAEPAGTLAPEAAFSELLDEIDAAFTHRFHTPLFRPHEDKQHVLSRIHRFRALESKGLLALAKDVARLTADSIDVAQLRTIVNSPPGTTLGSLKLLEQTLATLVEASDARSALSPLVGAYELRLGDAHLPSGKLKEAYKLVPIETTETPIGQAVQLLDGVSAALRSAVNMLK